MGAKVLFSGCLITALKRRHWPSAKPALIPSSIDSHSQLSPAGWTKESFLTLKMGIPFGGQPGAAVPSRRAIDNPYNPRVCSSV